MTLFLFIIMASKGHYYANSSIYDTELKAIRDGVHVLVSQDGSVSMVSSSPIPTSSDITRTEGALLLPHLSDFYSLVQERGLGLDEDIDLANQARMARYLRRIGIQKVRDPIFPPVGLSPMFVETLEVFAGRGYLELENGPGADICRTVKLEDPLEATAQLIPAEGPVTLWWTTRSGDVEVAWPQHADYVKQLIAFFKGQGRAVGAYIQDAGVNELARLPQFDFDFYEGLPAVTVDVTLWPDVVWVPLASLNDKRYCAYNLKERLERMKGLGLYEHADWKQALKAVPSIQDRISARCQVWRERRPTAMEPLARWIDKGGKLGLGSGGGHSFSFSGDIHTEIEILDELGASQAQLLEAAFRWTPSLLGSQRAYLEVGRPANFVVYNNAGYWGRHVGTSVTKNYVDGKDVRVEMPLPLKGLDLKAK